MNSVFWRLWLKLLLTAWQNLKRVLTELDRWIRTTTPLARLAITGVVLVLTFITFYGFFGIVGTLNPIPAAICAVIAVLVMHARVYLAQEPTPKDTERNVVSDHLQTQQTESFDSSMYAYSDDELDTHDTE